MELIEKDGETIKVFDDVEELKWYVHAKLCRCEHFPMSLENFLNQLYAEYRDESLNEWLEHASISLVGEHLRVKNGVK